MEISNGTSFLASVIRLVLRRTRKVKNIVLILNSPWPRHLVDSEQHHSEMVCESLNTQLP